jgi:hypothetical protein
MGEQQGKADRVDGRGSSAFVRLARKLWRPGTARRRFIPSSVVVAVVYLVIHRLLFIMYTSVLSAGPLAAFWQTPVLGPICLLWVFHAVNIMLLVYLVLDCAVTCLRRDQRKLGHFCAYVVAVIGVGLYQTALYQAGASMDVLYRDTLAYNRQHPSLAFRYGPMSEVEQRRLGDLLKSALRVRIRPKGAAGNVSYILHRRERSGDGWKLLALETVARDGLRAALSRHVGQESLGSRCVVVSILDGTWQDLVSVCESAFEAGFARVVLEQMYIRAVRDDTGKARFFGVTFCAEVLPNRLPVMSRSDRTTLAKNDTILVKVMTDDEYEFEHPAVPGLPDVMIENPLAPQPPVPSGPDRAFVCRIGPASVDPEDVERLSDDLHWEHSSIHGDGDGATTVLIQAARQVRYRDLIPTIAATVLETKDLPGRRAEP